MKDVDLTASAVLKDDRLRVRYSVTNRRSGPIFLFDFAFADGGARADVFPSVAYAAPDVAVLSSVVATPPAGIAWATPPTIYGTRLMPGETATGERTHALPLRATADPFASPASLRAWWQPAARATNCKRLRIVFGVVGERSEFGATAESRLGAAVFEMRASAAGRHEYVRAEVDDIDVALLR